MLRRLVLMVGGLTLFSFGFLTSASAQSFVHSYQSATALQFGMIVQLTSKNSSAVTPATETNQAKAYGVVINPAQSSVTVTSPSDSNEVFVATSGTYSVLVTNQNGAINPGDYVSVSALNGFGDKATSKDSTTIGRALTAFKGNSSDSLGSTSLNESGGKQLPIQYGRIAVSLNIALNPLSAPPPGVPSFIKSAGQSIANKAVSNARLYICLVILVATVVIVGSMLYSGVRSSLISVGRNPLTRTSIIRALVQVLLTSLFVLAIGLATVYVLLRV